jgi:hypothetical protein
MVNSTKANLEGGQVVTLSGQRLTDYTAEKAMYDSTATERALVVVRSLRDRLLNNSDSTQASDRPNNASKTAWQEYRQKLRDITVTNALGNPSNAVDLQASYKNKFRPDNPEDDGMWPLKP